MAAAGAQRTRPAGLAIVFIIDVAAIQEIGLLFAIDTGGDIPQRVSIGIDKAVARRDVARWTHTEQP